jgi:transposase
LRALRGTAGRIQALNSEADDLEQEITQLIARVQPQLMNLPGEGPISAPKS